MALSSGFKPFSSFSQFTDPEDNAPIGGSPGPLAVHRPEKMESFQRKWGAAATALQARGIPREAWAPVMEIDLQRASSGQNVLSANETLLAIRAAHTGDAQMEHPKGNILTRAARDVRQVVSAIPKLPLMMAEEVTKLPQTLPTVAEGIQEGDVGKIAGAPGVRMVPGAFTVENIAEGRSPLDHPVLTLLDVLPYAGKAVGALPKVKTASAALREEGALLKARPLRTAGREYIAKPLMDLSEARTGKPYTGVLTKFGLSSTRQGELAKQAAVAGRHGDEVMALLSDEFTKIRKRRGIDEARAPVIHDAAATGRLGELTPNEAAYVEEMRAAQERIITPEGLRANAENPKEGIVEIDGEFYEARSGLAPKVRKLDKTIGAKQRGIAKLAPQVEGIKRGKAVLDQVLDRNPLYESGTFKTLDGRVESVLPEDIVNSWAESQGLEVRGPDAARVMYEQLGPDGWLLAYERIHDDFLDASLKDVYGGDIANEVLHAGEPVVIRNIPKERVDFSDIDYSNDLDASRLILDAMEGKGMLNDIVAQTIGDPTPLRVAEAPLAEYPRLANGMYGEPHASAYFHENYDVLRSSLEDALDALPKEAWDQYGWSHTQGKKKMMAAFDAMPKIGRTAEVATTTEKALNLIYRSKKAKAKSIERAIERGRFGEAAKWSRALSEKLQAIYDEAAIRGVDLKTVGDEAAKWGVRADELDFSAQFLTVRRAYREKAKNLPLNEERLAALKDAESEAAQRRADLIEQTPPARYEPLIREQALKNLKARVSEAGEGTLKTKLEEAGTIPDEIDWAEIQIRMEEDLPMQIAGLSEGEIRAAMNEARQTWMEMKAQGSSPVFVHALDLDQVQSLNRPMKAMARQEVTPTSFRGRTLDPKPTIKNLEIAMLHQGREIVQNIVDRRVRDWVTNESGWAKSGEQLFAEYEAMARRMMESGYRLPPGTTPGSLVNTLITNDYSVWNPKSLTPLAKGNLTRANMKAMYVPKWLDKAMNDMYPHSRSALGGVLDKAHSVFRTSILPLSPRWHINNVIGGAVMLSAEGGLGVWKHWGAARKMLKNGELPMEISRGAGNVPAADAAWQLATGRELGRIWQNEQLRKVQATGQKGGQAFRQATDYSFHMGEQVDLFYRSLAYLEGKTKGQRLGLSHDAARKAGVEMADRVLQDWDRMTPVERSVIRMVFPFYGWMKHIMRFTMSMPIDHPVRTAIMANFARNEIEDWGTGIPERFFQMFTLGKPDANGTVQANFGLNPLDWSGSINMKGTNPFSDVANYMSLAGFVGQLSPVGSGLLEAMGINSATGTANLYPDTVYNEVLGRNVAKGPNPGLSILRNVIPQFDFVMDALGMTPAELRNLKINDPDLYNQRIFSSIGIPFIPKDLNLHREAALAEIARNKDATDALNRALRTGDWSGAEQYPQIAPLLSVLRNVPRSQIDPLVMGERPKLAS